MEKRLLLSLILSFMVLYLWAMFTRPDTEMEPQVEPQIVAQEKLSESPKDSGIEVENALSSLANVDVEVPEPVTTLKVLENDKVRVEISGKGAKVTKATVKRFDETFPVRGVSSISGLEDLAFGVVDGDDNRVVLRTEKAGRMIEVIHSLPEDDYVLKSKVKVSNSSLSPQSYDLRFQNINIEMSSLDNKGGLFGGSEESRESMMNEYSALLDGKVKRKSNASKFKDGERDTKFGNVAWIGYRNRYYAIVLKPLFSPQGYFVEPKSENELDFGLIANSFELEPQESRSFEFLTYIGPQELTTLKSYGYDFQKIVNFGIGNFFDWFALGLGDPAAKLLLSILKFYKGIIGSWGISIILLAMSVCLFTYPLFMKSMKSMKKMQLLQPEMVKIKEKYKDKPEKYNKEVMELYKKHQENPSAGCLPMFIQMPIFFGVIQLLWRYVGLKGEGFWWIKDLAEPDRLFMLPFSIPILGNEVNILPIIVFILTIIQQRVSSKNMVVSDPNMAMQQKMMKFMLPAMIIIFFYRFASAIGLYFAVFYVYQIIVQMRVAAHNKIA